MNSAEKPHWNANSSVSSILRRYPVFRISKPFLSRFITASSRSFHFHARVLRSRRIQPVQTSGKYCRDRPPEEQRLFHQKLGRANGSGGFGTATNFAVGLHPRDITSADFNGD